MPELPPEMVQRCVLELAAFLVDSKGDGRSEDYLRDRATKLLTALPIPDLLEALEGCVKHLEAACEDCSIQHYRINPSDATKDLCKRDDFCPEYALLNKARAALEKIGMTP